MTDQMSARALWITAQNKAEIRDTLVDVPSEYSRIKTLFSGISKGTEGLVFGGGVPASEHATMRAPFQDGNFDFPVKYGYCAVGRVQSGAHSGEVVFALFPHQDQFAVPPDMVVQVPSGVSPKRAVMAANMETALNILWDSQISAGDNVAVVGCGVVGALVGYLAARIPGTSVCGIDVNPARAGLATTLGFDFAAPDDAIEDADVVIHASATSAGLNTALSCAGIEAKVVEASWYGDRMTNVALGGRFHQRRLHMISSQVGRIPSHRAARWTYARRLNTAMALLDDPALDVLINGETAFEDLPQAYGAVLADPNTLCHAVRYDG